MEAGKQDVIAAGAWLKGERAKRGEQRCSSGKVAMLATVLARRQSDPITIHQQQISQIENATEDKGPKKLPPWFRYVRLLFESGQMDQALEAIETPARQPTISGDNIYLIQSPTGEIVGRIVWDKPPTI